MNFDLLEAIEILERTPETINNLLLGLSESWLTCNEGENTWNTIEVVGHLIECEKYNWIPRLETILVKGESESFPPFDRFSHMQQIIGKSIDELIREFTDLRKNNLIKLKSLLNTDSDFEITGIHPDFGIVKLRELISTWVVHDLTHLSQITRVIANRYKIDVGPWEKYLSILK